MVATHPFMNFFFQNGGVPLASTSKNYVQFLLLFINKDLIKKYGFAMSQSTEIFINLSHLQKST
jgi:hypothetical protein